MGAEYDNSPQGEPRTKATEVSAETTIDKQTRSHLDGLGVPPTLNAKPKLVRLMLESMIKNGRQVPLDLAFEPVDGDKPKTLKSHIAESLAESTVLCGLPALAMGKPMWMLGVVALSPLLIWNGFRNDNRRREVVLPQKRQEFRQEHGISEDQSEGSREFDMAAQEAKRQFFEISEELAKQFQIRALRTLKRNMFPSEVRNVLLNNFTMRGAKALRKRAMEILDKKFPV